jgi:hypothetical protein
MSKLQKSQNNILVEEPISLHIKAKLKFHLNSGKEFKGILKRGVRLVMWGNKKATSCSIVNDTFINKDSETSIDLVIFIIQSLDKPVAINETFKIGYPGIELGIFRITDIVGIWKGKIP